MYQPGIYIRWPGILGFQQTISLTEKGSGLTKLVVIWTNNLPYDCCLQEKFSVLFQMCYYSDSKKTLSKNWPWLIFFLKVTGYMPLTFTYSVTGWNKIFALPTLVNDATEHIVLSLIFYWVILYLFVWQCFRSAINLIRSGLWFPTLLSKFHS